MTLTFWRFTRHRLRTLQGELGNLDVRSITLYHDAYWPSRHTLKLNLSAALLSLSPFPNLLIHSFDVSKHAILKIRLGNGWINKVLAVVPLRELTHLSLSKDDLKFGVLVFCGGINTKEPEEKTQWKGGDQRQTQPTHITKIMLWHHHSFPISVDIQSR